MEFALSDDQRMLKEAVDRFLSDKVTLDVVRKIAVGDIDARDSIERGLAELGLNGILVGEEHGGAGLGLLDAVLVQEALGYAIAPSAFMSNAVSSYALRDFHPELTGEIAAGSASFGFALNEVMSRRDGAGVSNTTSGLNGLALVAFSAETATHMLVASSDNMLHVCDAGISESMSSIDKTRTFSQRSFESVAPRASLPMSEHVLAVAHLLIAADTLGAAQAMLDKAVAYAAERQQFGRVIGSFQAVKHMCAEMAAKLEPSRAFIWHAAHMLDLGEHEGIQMAHLAKAHLSEVGTFIARTSTEVHGGMGFTDLVGLHYWFKRIGMNRQLLGSPMQVRELAARVQGLIMA